MNPRRLLLLVVSTLSLMTAGGCAAERGPGVAEPGAALYGRACGACHGSDANGTAAAPSLAGASEQAIRAAVAQGVDADPAFGAMAPIDLTPAQLEAIVSHLDQAVLVP